MELEGVIYLGPLIVKGGFGIIIESNGWSLRFNVGVGDLISGKIL